MKAFFWIFLFILIFILPGTHLTSVCADSHDAEIQAELKAASEHSSKINLTNPTQKDGPPSAEPLQSIGTVIYSSDFESDNGGMSGALDWIWGTYNWVGDNCHNTDRGPNPPVSAHSGTKMWGTKLNDCYENRGNNTDYTACNNEDSDDDSILLFTVDLTGVDSAHLRW